MGHAFFIICLVTRKLSLSTNDIFFDFFVSPVAEFLFCLREVKILKFYSELYFASSLTKL
jgi:hypothetical protein